MPRDEYRLSQPLYSLVLFITLSASPPSHYSPHTSPHILSALFILSLSKLLWLFLIVSLCFQILTLLILSFAPYVLHFPGFVIMMMIFYNIHLSVFFKHPFNAVIVYIVSLTISGFYFRNFLSGLSASFSLRIVFLFVLCLCLCVCVCVCVCVRVHACLCV